MKQPRSHIFVALLCGLTIASACGPEVQRDAPDDAEAGRRYDPATRVVPKTLADWDAPQVFVDLRPHDDNSVDVSASLYGAVSFDDDHCTLEFQNLRATLDGVELHAEIPTEIREGVGPSSKVGCPYPVFSGTVPSAPRGGHRLVVEDESRSLQMSFGIGDASLEVIDAQVYAHPGGYTFVNVQPAPGLEVTSAFLIEPDGDWAECFAAPTETAPTCFVLTGAEVYEDHEVLVQLPEEPTSGEFELHLTLGQTPPTYACGFDVCTLWQQPQVLDPLPIILGEGR